MEPDPSDFNLDFTQHNPAICLTNSAGFYRNATSPKVPGNFQGISSWNMIVSSTSVCFMLGMSPKFCPTKAPFTIEHSQLIHRALKTENWLIDFLYRVYIYIYILLHIIVYWFHYLLKRWWFYSTVHRGSRNVFLRTLVSIITTLAFMSPGGKCFLKRLTQRFPCYIVGKRAMPENMFMSK